MAPRRKLSPAYERRNQRARALGYRSYYDYRAHDNGRLPPDAAPVKGERLGRLRGHRSATDLVRSVKTGSLVMVVNHSERDASTGQYTWVEVVTVDPSGRERSFRLRGPQLRRRRLERTVTRIERRGGVLSPSPSLDIRRFA